MLATAVLLPDTALLVPGAAGRAVLLGQVRDAAVEAVRAALEPTGDPAPDRVVVVAPGPSDRELDGPVEPSLAAVGIDAAELGWTARAGAGGTVAGVAASVALLLLGQVGWTGPVGVVELAPSTGPVDGAAARGQGLRERGRRLVEGPERVVLLVVGSLSARNGPGAPVRGDARAPAFDGAILADLAAGDDEARGRLAAVPEALATELVATAWAPLQVLCGAADGTASIDAAVRWSGAPLGVTYPVAVWRARSGDPVGARRGEVAP